MQMKQNFLILITLVGWSLLVSCNGQQTPPLTVLPVEEIQQTLDVKRLFRYSDFGNTCFWVVPDDKGNLTIQLGRESSYRTLWNGGQSFGFPMKGGAEGAGRIAVPPAGESGVVEIPVSFEVPWSLSADSVPEIHSRLLSLGFSQRGEFSFQFGEDTPFAYIVADIQVILPPCLTTGDGAIFPLPEKNGFRYYVQVSTDTPFSEDVYMTGSSEVPEQYRSLSDRSVRLDDVLTVNGMLRLDRASLKKGYEWPDHLDFSFSLTHQGSVYRTHSAVKLPTDYTLPDISFKYDLDIRPYLFQGAEANIHLYDTRLRMDFLNKSPFKMKLRGKVASYKNGEVLRSVPFGDDVVLEAKKYNARKALYSGDSSCEKRIILSEFNRFPVSLPEPYMEGDHEHASLQIAGLSSLFAGDPDDIRFTDLHVERDPDEIVNINSVDFEEASLKLQGRVDTPLQAGKDFSAQTYLTLYFPRNLFPEDLVLNKVIVEGTLSSTLPFNVELEDVKGMDGVTISRNKTVLPPSLGEEASSAHFQVQLESNDNLKDRMNTSFIFRLSVDETCIGKPINESSGISLTDVVVKY